MEPKEQDNAPIRNQPIPDDDINPYYTVIRLLGAGGSGNNTITRLMKRQPKGIETIALNTDAQNLLETRADRKILIGKNITGGLGSGGDPMMGERAAEESKEVIAATIEGTDLLVLTCGLGGGTGTGSLPIIGEIAQSKGILTIAIVTMPFTDEGIIRWENAQIGLEKLRKTVDTIIVLKNDKLLELYQNRPLVEAFRAGDEILINMLVGLSNLIVKNGLINLDFADVSMVMRDGPDAVIGVGESNSENRVEEAIKRAISHPMMEAEINGAHSALIHVSGGPDMTLKEARQIIHQLSQMLDSNARVIWGATVENKLKHTIRIMLIVSGLKKEIAMQDLETERTKKHITEPLADELEAFDAFEQQTGSKSSIFDIKESILASEAKIATAKKSTKQITQTTLVFYKIFEEEATGDLKRFDRAIHFLRENLENRKALIDALQACKLLHASAQMFGFDEIAQLLAAIDEILTCIESKEIQLTTKTIDSITLAMEMVVDLVQNRSDGRGETGYIVDRLKEIKDDKLSSYNPDGSLSNL
jgi:cell division protein FtsZ